MLIFPPRTSCNGVQPSLPRLIETDALQKRAQGKWRRWQVTTYWSRTESVRRRRNFLFPPHRIATRYNSQVPAARKRALSVSYFFLRFSAACTALPQSRDGSGKVRAHPFLWARISKLLRLTDGRTRPRKHYL